MKSELVGYVRKTKNGNALKISLSVEALDNAERYLSQDGSEYIGLVINTGRIGEIIDGSRDVTSVCQVVEE